MHDLLGMRAALLIASLAVAPVNPVQAQGAQPSAADVIGLAHFVDHYCRAYRTNEAVVMTVLKAAGETEQSLMRPDIVQRARVLSNNYARDVAKSCRLAWAMFGDRGTLFPGMVVPRRR